MIDVQRPGWDEWALSLARTVATRADCSRRQVGAVILDAEHRVISTGYNGAPAGQPGCLTRAACPRAQSDVAAYSSYDNCISVHAEVNAILYARQSLRGCVLYCTDEPCVACWKVIDAVGLTVVTHPRVRRLPK